MENNKMTFFYVTADIYYREPHQKKEMHVLKSTRENTATLREREICEVCVLCVLCALCEMLCV